MPSKKLIYQFKVTLKETSPRVWRRIQVPSTYTFWDLHVANQEAQTGCSFDPERIDPAKVVFSDPKKRHEQQVLK